MKKCASCSKELKWFNFEYSCKSCGKVYCSTCENICLQEFFTSKIISNIPQSLLSLIEELEELEELEKSISFNLPFLTGNGDVLCKTCFQKRARNVIETFKSIEGYQDVSCYSKNYKGHIPAKKGCLHLAISTPWFRDKQKAEEFLKIQCKLNKGNMVYNMAFEYEQREDGYYVYKVWKATGIAAQKE